MENVGNGPSVSGVASIDNIEPTASRPIGEDTPSSASTETESGGLDAIRETEGDDISRRASDAFVASVKSSESNGSETGFDVDLGETGDGEGTPSATVLSDEDHAQDYDVQDDEADEGDLLETGDDTPAAPVADVDENGMQLYNYNYLYLEYFEPIFMYNKNGFHPIHLGDVLNDRFEVFHKLGFGGSATIWMCWDLEQEKWRAVKVMDAGSSGKTREERILAYLRENCTAEELEENHIGVPLESFWIEGPNGRHLCHVMHIYGEPVHHWRGRLDGSKKESWEVATEVCGQITEALAFIHQKGVCHGDFRPSNILMKLDQDKINELSRDEMGELLGTPDAWGVELKSGAKAGPIGPEYLVCDASSRWCEKFVTKSFNVVDFGESFLTSDPRERTGLPDVYAPPELLFKQGNALKVDLWSLACTIYEVRTRDHIFRDFWGGEVVSEIVGVLGPLPEPYESLWEAEMQEIFDKNPQDTDENPQEDSGENLPDSDENPLNTNKKELEAADDAHMAKMTALQEEADATKAASPYKGVAYLLAEEREKYFHRTNEPPLKYRYEHDEIVSLADLLTGLFQYKPEDRTTADVALRHGWLKDTTAGRKAFLREQESRKRGKLYIAKLAAAVSLGLALTILLVWSLATGKMTDHPNVITYLEETDHTSCFTGERKPIPLRCTCDVPNLFDPNQQC